jgi:hypothetical protein
MGKHEREEVETVDGRVYWSDDGWETVFKSWGGGYRLRSSRRRLVIDKAEAALARSLAIHKYGGGRDEVV